jgi:hypothetical protein
LRRDILSDGRDKWRSLANDAPCLLQSGEIMPRYFFSVHDGRSELDTEGTELTSRHAARFAAVQMAGGLLRDEAYRRMHGDAWRLEVLDEASALVCRVEVNVIEPSADQ